MSHLSSGYNRWNQLDVLLYLSRFWLSIKKQSDTGKQVVMEVDKRSQAEGS